MLLTLLLCVPCFTHEGRASLLTCSCLDICEALAAELAMSRRVEQGSGFPTTTETYVCLEINLKRKDLFIFIHVCLCV